LIVVVSFKEEVMAWFYDLQLIGKLMSANRFCRVKRRKFSFFCNLEGPSSNDGVFDTVDRLVSNS